MKVSFVFLALSMVLATSAIPQGSHLEVRQFGGFGNNGGGFGGFGGGRNGGNNNNNNNNTNGGKNGGNTGTTKGNTNTGGNTGKNQGGNTGKGNNQNNGGAAGGNNNNGTNTGTGANNGTNTGAGANNGTNTGTGANTGNNANNGTNAGDNQDPQKSTTLDPKVIATGFANDGQDVPADGQVASLTSTNNFINFCLTVPNLPITNGKQITTGSCNPAPMGILPSTDNMPSCKFVSPKNGDTLKENTAFTITMAIRGMQTGFFVNAQENYFAAPQFLNAQGQIQGHSHVVVELLSAIDQTTPLDPKKFAFFKGLNAPAANGQLTADVTAGLPAGNYKLSSINSAANHQPVLVPIAQHGSLDDAVYFTITADGKPDANSGVLNGGNNGTAAGNTGAGAGNTGAGAGGAGNTGAGNTNTGNQTTNTNTGTGGKTNTGNTNTGTGKGGNQNTNTGKGGNQNTNTGNGKNQNTNTGNNQNQNTNTGNGRNNNGGFGGFGGFGGRNRRFARSRL